jgi:hypothetical protein
MPSLATPSPPEGGEGRVRGMGSRRAFLAAVSLSLLAPLAVQAQQSGKKLRIGVLGIGGGAGSVIAPCYAHLGGNITGIVTAPEELTGKQLGLTIPPSVLGRADEVIQ